jgi:hypothetical protein
MSFVNPEKKTPSIKISVNVAGLIPGNPSTAKFPKQYTLLPSKYLPK